MGINKLRYYIAKYGNFSPITERVRKDRIYNTRVIYLDALGKLIEIYHQFLEIADVASYEKLFDYEVSKFSTYLIKISYYKRKVYVFVDYHYVDNLAVQDLILPEYLPSIDPELKVYKQDESYRFVGEEGEDIVIEEDRIIPNENIPHDELLKVWYRYLIKVKCKESMHERRKKEVEEEIDESYDDNIFRKFIHNFEDFTKKLKANPDLSHVSFYGCSIECDFAMTKHIKLYSNSLYPIIITNDTDFAALLCDVDCLIKYVFGKKTYFIHPPTFWKKVFDNVTLSSKIIKTLCVIKGVDYNIKDDITKLRDFSDILGILGVHSFSDLTEELLNDYIRKYLEENKNNENTKYTALALNVYLVNMENTFYEI